MIHAWFKSYIRCSEILCIVFGRVSESNRHKSQANHKRCDSHHTSTTQRPHARSQPAISPFNHVPWPRIRMAETYGSSRFIPSRVTQGPHVQSPKCLYQQNTLYDTKTHQHHVSPNAPWYPSAFFVSFTTGQARAQERSGDPFALATHYIKS